MCWSGEASFALSAAGLVGATAYLIKSKEEKVLWIPLLYFTAMELLQGFNYLWIGACGLPQNQIFALVGYAHIMFQPFFCNAVALYFIPKQVRDNIGGYVYAACLLVPFVLIYKLYPFDWAGRLPGRKRAAMRRQPVRIKRGIAYRLGIAAERHILRLVAGHDRPCRYPFGFPDCFWRHSFDRVFADGVRDADFVRFVAYGRNGLLERPGVRQSADQQYQRNSGRLVPVLDRHLLLGNQILA